MSAVPSVSSVSSVSATRTVRTAQGAVAGARHGDFAVFRGVPYAAPPGETGRFAPPRPAAAWTGVRDATVPGPTAPQPVRALGDALDMTPYFGAWSRGEDYLTVDVWTPEQGREGLPVMVFVHGGGFVAGSPGAGLYDGSAFARDGVVLVNVTYRLGIAGFLDVPGAPRNRGLLDVLAALRWVRENIAAFGGDPELVTLFGQSAGATLTGALLADPRAAGLFRRAVVQSGSGLGAFTPEQAARVTAAAAAELDIAPHAAAFARIPDAELVAATARLGGLGLDLRTAGAYDPLLGLSPFAPVLDQQPAAGVAAGHARDVDLLVGTNTEEGNLYLVPSGAYAASTLDDVRDLAARAHPDPGALVAAYRAAHPGAEAGELRSAVLGDALFGAGSWALAGAHAGAVREGGATGAVREGGATGAVRGGGATGATYGYLFDWRSGALDGRLGATHTVELPFVFGLDPEPLCGPAGMLGPDRPPAELIARTHAAWVAFARTGDPGWAPYDSERRATMVIGERWTVREDPRGAVRRGWEGR